MTQIPFSFQRFPVIISALASPNKSQATVIYRNMPARLVSYHGPRHGSVKNEFEPAEEGSDKQMMEFVRAAGNSDPERQSAHSHVYRML